MRFRLPMGRTLLFVCVFILAMIVLIPMRLGLAWLDLDDRGVAARETRGSVWNGRLVEAQLGDTQLGTIDAGLGFFPLLIGRARLAMERDALPGEEIAQGEFRGALAVSGADFAIHDLTAKFPASGLLAPLPVTQLDLSDLTARFENGLCVEANGSVRIALRNELEGIPLPTSALGTARCEDGALLLPMIAQSGMEQINLRLESSGAFTAELQLRPDDQSARERLIANGFQPAGNGYVLTVEGQL